MSLNDFIQNFQGGTRNHRYKFIDGSFPAMAGAGSLKLSKYTVRALEIPPSQLNPIRIPYRGRILKWPGDRLYFPWTIRILDDQQAGGLSSVWEAFHTWSNGMNDHVTNVHDTPGAGSSGTLPWATDWTIAQLDEQGDEPANVIKEIKLVGCWPTVIGPINLDANSIDTLVEFTVTIEYQWYEILTPGVNSTQNEV